MNTSLVALIVAVEIALLLFVACIVLFRQNRSLKQLVDTLKSRAQSLMQELKSARKAPAQSAPLPPPVAIETAEAPASRTYLDYVNEQLSLTLDYHASLNSNQDIALDLDPASPLPFRAAALRHAVLLAESEAVDPSSLEPDWRSLRNRYDQLFRFNEEYAINEGEEEPADTPELSTLRTELDNALKRMSNLEKYKTLYFKLEEQWEASKQEVQTRYADLSNMAARIDDGGEIEKALTAYHASYGTMTQILQEGIDQVNKPAVTSGEIGENDNLQEVRRLRAVAADQHRIIEGLQKRLRDANSTEERAKVVESLQDELQKQMRFVQESETCIQLLEDELNLANAELDNLRSKSARFTQVKADMIDLRKQFDSLEIKHHSTITENRKLQKRLQEASRNAKSGSDQEAIKLRKELAEMQARYNELEERFLDLKLQQ